jgi:hypothetical protein
VHLVHNCAESGCHPTQTRVRRQERRTVEGLTWELQHCPNANFLFNHAQMGNARFIRPLLPSVRYPQLAKDELIRQAVAHHRVLVEEGGDRPSRRRKQQTDTSNPAVADVPSLNMGPNDGGAAVLPQIDSAVGPVRSQGRGRRRAANATSSRPATSTQ